MAIRTDKWEEYFGLDLRTVLAQVKLREDVYERILRLALHSTQESWTVFVAAMDAGDRAGIYQFAHESKGVYANLRITCLQQLCDEIGKKAQAGDAMTELRRLAAHFKEHLDHLDDVLGPSRSL